MSKPTLSRHFQTLQPSAIRLAQIEFMKRQDNTQAVNVAIGNVSLPMHPAMQQRMAKLASPASPFKNGVVKYTPTVGVPEAQEAFKNIIAASDCDSQPLHVQITDGGSAAMELVILGVCGPAGSGLADSKPVDGELTDSKPKNSENPDVQYRDQAQPHTKTKANNAPKPLLLIDAAYTNYTAMAARVGRATVSVTRTLQPDGQFSLPDFQKIENVIKKHQPGALLVIPYDNPTGQFYNQAALNRLAKLCVKYNLWMISDEAYRELYYQPGKSSSIWAISEKAVPGVTGRRISIESSSKVWNACGLRIGALVTDNQTFHEQSVAEYTANLCPNAIGQYIFGALAHESQANLQQWFDQQRAYYQNLGAELTQKLKQKLPKLIVSQPQAAIYSVVDVSQVVPDNFDAQNFVMYCAQEGKVKLAEGKAKPDEGPANKNQPNKNWWTLLVSPMAGFYNPAPGQKNPGKQQMRLAYVETPENMAKVPKLFTKLLQQYLEK